MHQFNNSFEQKAVIVQVDLPREREKFSSNGAFAEFKDLVISSGAHIIYEDVSKQNQPSAGLFIGKGRAERIRDCVEDSGSDLVIFNGPESELKLTKNTQPAIMTVGVSIFKALNLH